MKKKYDRIYNEVFVKWLKFWIFKIEFNNTLKVGF